MTLVPCNIQEADRAKERKYTDLYRTLMDFAESGLECMEVKDFSHKTAAYCASSIAAAIKRYHLYNIRAVQRRDRVFLIRDNK